MRMKFRVGDHASWNRRRASGRIVEVHASDFDYKGHRHRASPDNPHYEIKSDRSEHIAAHYGKALRKLQK
jgi:hypothetical protein